MLVKTLTGLIGGFIISLLTSLILVSVLPGSADNRLFIAVITSFSCWIAVIFYGYLSEKQTQTLLRLTLIILALAAITFAVSRG